MTTSAQGVLTMLLAMAPFPVVVGVITWFSGEATSEAVAIAGIYAFFMLFISLFSAIFVGLPLQALLTRLGLFKWYVVTCCGGVAGALLAYWWARDGASLIVVPVFLVFGSYGGFWYWYGVEKIAG